LEPLAVSPFQCCAEGGAEKVMNRRILTFVLASSALLSVIAFAAAQQSGTAPEANAMLDRVVTALKANEAAAISCVQRQE
jgi:hypothetical protein